MRALLAAALALVLVAAFVAPHVHAHAATTSAGDECTLCTVRHAAPPRTTVPDFAPIEHVAGVAAFAPGLPPVFGAPLGAIPGQSPPAAAA